MLHKLQNGNWLDLTKIQSIKVINDGKPRIVIEYGNEVQVIYNLDAEHEAFLLAEAVNRQKFQTAEAENKLMRLFELLAEKSGFKPSVTRDLKTGAVNGRNWANGILVLSDTELLGKMCRSIETTGGIE